VEVTTSETRCTWNNNITGARLSLCLIKHHVVTKTYVGMHSQHRHWVREADLNTVFEKKKLRGLSPQANYTDRATAACQRS
jgi:hypothetical protein